MIYLYRLLVATAAVLVIQKACTGKHENKPVQVDITTSNASPEDVAQRFSQTIRESDQR